MKLYTSYLSNAAYRVRIALDLKDLPYEPEYVLLNKDTGEDQSPEYLGINPLGMVPTLIDGHRVYRQSLSILEYLEDVYPVPSILPGSSRDRERIRSLSLVIATDIEPLTNFRIQAYMNDKLSLNDEQYAQWNRHWIHKGLQALEKLMEDNPATSSFCHGDLPTMADICLVSQVHGYEQQGWDLHQYPTVARIYQHCMNLSAFSSTAPQYQPDAQVQT